MSIVNRIPKLECKNRISMPPDEFGTKLIRFQTVLIQPITPFDFPKDVEFAADKPISWFVDNLQKTKTIEYN